jgi:hypothetical protein
MKLKSHINDIVFLAGTVLASVGLYFHKLGFVSDDWAFLSIFHASAAQSMTGLIQAFSQPDLVMRPIQIVYYSLLFLFFGLNPLGYHLVNAGIIVSVCLMGWLVLRQLNLPRIIAIALPLVYILLPHYSTNRFWFAAFLTNTSLLFYLVSLYTGLKALANSAQKFWLLTAVSLICAALSLLSYEVVMPVFLLNIVLFFKFDFHKIKKPVILGTGTILTVLMTMIYKAMVTTRFDSNIFSSAGAYLKYVAYLVEGPLYYNFGIYGVLLPRTFARLLYANFDPVIFIVALIVGSGIFWYLYRVLKSNNFEVPSKSFMAKLVFWGIVIYGLGYALFLITSNIGFTPSGISNRVNLVSAIGIAFMILGGVGWISKLVKSERVSSIAFSLLISFISLSNFYIINTLANYWTKAYNQELVILRDIKENIPEPRSDSTLILDGICPYVGPGIVFESSWDLLGALKIQYNGNITHADVVTPRMSVAEDGIHTYIYGTNKSKYEYHNLYIYNFVTKQTAEITNQTEAQKYFNTHNPDFDNDCPPGREGHGVSIL